MKMYLAGPVFGETTWRAKDNFAKGYRLAKAAGYEPINPLEIFPDEHNGACPPGRPGMFGHTDVCHMRADLAELLKCDAILLLDGWNASWGVRLELSVATACGLWAYQLVGDGEEIKTVGGHA